MQDGDPIGWTRAALETAGVQPLDLHDDILPYGGGGASQHSNTSYTYTMGGGGRGSGGGGGGGPNSSGTSGGGGGSGSRRDSYSDTADVQLVIDEAQDLNGCQYDLYVTQQTKCTRVLYGDRYQAIYAFRGAGGVS